MPEHPAGTSDGGLGFADGSDEREDPALGRLGSHKIALGGSFVNLEPGALRFSERGENRHTYTHFEGTSVPV